ncbi:uncharacterized protein V1478_005101 [Vespula squamosa]|uniref:Uncharacterized protein n=1 Tax=Vespula squamosa TaxID=30214 RepID=A0ABD2BD67_VESSQ
MKYIERFRSTDNVPRKIKQRKTNARIDRRIHRLSKADRFKTVIAVHSEIIPDLNKKIFLLNYP